jgi:hypothetical protein
MQQQLPVDSSIATSDPEALITQPARFGLSTKTIKPTVHRVGVSQDGEWYLYGETAKTKDRTPVEALATPRILDIQVVVRATRTSDFGPRPYLDVTMLGETPAIRYVLTLPCAFVDQRTGGRHTPSAVRSLLGCLITLDLAATPLKLEPSRGTKANFTNVYLDPDGLQQVRAERIGDGEADLQSAVDACRRKLGLAPQFALADAAVQPSLALAP